MSKLLFKTKRVPARQRGVWLLAALAIMVGCLSARAPLATAQTPPAAGGPLTALAPLSPHTASVTGSAVQTAAAATHRSIAPYLKQPPFSQSTQARASASAAVKASRDPATASLAPPTGSSALVAANAPLVLAGNTNFDGADATVSGAEPPDTDVAAGPDHVVETTNVVMRIWSKTGTLFYTVDLGQFLGIPSNIDTISDPNIVFDTGSGRFFLALIGYDSTAAKGYMWIVVSNSSDPSGTWTYYINTEAGQLPDYPTIGYNDDKVVVGANAFHSGACTDGFCYTGGQYWVFNKAQLTSAATLHNSFFAPDASVFTVQPARSQTSTATEFMLSEGNDSTKLALWSVTGVPGVSTVSSTFTQIAVNAVVAPPDAVQEDNTTIPSNDARLMQTTFRNGSLYSATAVACDWTSSGDQVRSCLRYWQFSTAGTPTVVQDSIFGSPGLYYTYPALSLDASGNVAIVFTRVGPSEFAGTRFTGRLASDPANQLELSSVLKAGNGNYFDARGQRWGDFSGAGIDPRDPTQIWLAGEYVKGAGSSSLWGTYIGRVTEVMVSKAEVSAPVPDTTLSSTSTTFHWTTGVGADAYWLYVGTNGVGSLNVFNSNQLSSSTTTAVVSNLPANGTSVNVRLWTHFASGWAYNDYVFPTSPPPRQLTVSSSGCGSTNPSGTTTPTVGSAVSISATPCDGSHSFSGWTITGASCTAGLGSSPCAFSMPNAPVTVTSTFIVTPAQQLTISTTGCGSANPTGSSAPTIGSAISVTATACDANHGFSGWTIAGASCTAGLSSSPCAFGMPAGAVTLTANFIATGCGSASSTAAIVQPTPGTALAGSSATFCWTAGSNVAGYWLYVGTGGAGAYNLLSSGQLSSSTFSQAVNNLPTSGTLNVRLWYLQGSWQFTDFTFTGGPPQPQLTVSSSGCGSTNPSGTTMPTAGSAISISATPCDGSHSFSGWTITGASCTAGLGSSPCAFSMPNATVTVTATFIVTPAQQLTVNVTGCGSANPSGVSAPAIGAAISVAATACDANHGFSGWTIAGASCTAGLSSSPCAFSMPAGAVTLTANFIATGCGSASSTAAIVQPTPGTTLAGSSSTFCWTAGSNVAGYWLYVGTGGAGAYNLLSSGQLSSSTFSATVNNLPTSGTLNVRLWYLQGSWQFTDYTFSGGTAAPAARFFGSILINGQNAPSGAVVTAFAGSTLCGKAADAGLYTGSNYFVDIDGAIVACSTPGTILNFKVNGQAATPTGTVPVTLGSAVALNLSVTSTCPPAITSPAPGSTVLRASAPITFQWTACGTSAGYWVYAGSTGPGAYNLFSSGQLSSSTTSATLNSLPASATLYVRLWSLENGSWTFTDYTYVVS